MRHIRLIFLFSILSSLSRAQSSGKWRDKFERYYDTTKFSPAIPTDGLAHSFIEAPITLWYSEDTASIFMSFRDTLLVRVEGSMVNGKRQGNFTYSLIDDDNPIKTYRLYNQSFKDDVLSGIWETFSLDNKVVMRNQYKSGRQTGVQQYFRSDGQTLLSETEIFSENKYIEREYYPSGALMTETPFTNGKQNGIGKKFYENGQLEDYVEFKLGEIEGTRKYYHANGQLWVEQIFFAGRPWEHIVNYDKNGKIRDGGTLKDGNGSIIHYNEDGTIREILNFKAGIEEK